MSFKYINPGYLKLTSALETTDNGDVIPTTTQSKTGCAFYITSTSYEYMSTIKNMPTSAGAEFWVKADIYIPSSSSGNGFEIRTKKGSGITIRFNDNYSYAYYYLGNNQNTICRDASINDLMSAIPLRLDALNTAWLHTFLDSSNGYLEFKINNKYFGKYYGNTMPSGFVSSSTYMYAYLDILSKSKTCLLSNIIVSDEEISPTEKVVLLPVSSTVTDMESLTSGLYVADTASKTLLQSVNTASLIQEYGSDSKITGIALIGNPAYEVDDVIGSLTSLSKKNNTVTDHDTLALSVDTDAMILSSFSMPTDTTIADLSNIQFGWRAEE